MYLSRLSSAVVYLLAGVIRCTREGWFLSGKELGCAAVAEDVSMSAPGD